MKIIKKCIYCGGEIKSCNDFYDEEFHKELAKQGISKSEKFNCIECGQMYDKYLKLMKLKLAWLK